MRKYTACVITHGHLDVEWYQPLKSFAFWTAQALERLMAQEDPAPYVLDGQVFPLEEYLENMRPENRGALEALIRRGALKIGPFYTQFDEWIPDPEAMVRNCLWGCLRGERMGGAMRVGYLPDNFGHPTQLPQILRGFGIDSLLFMRGMPYIEEDFPDEFTLAGPDGSTLRATHFRDGYSRIYGKGIENFAEDFLPQFRPAPYYDDYISYEHYLEMTVIDDPDRHAREMIAYVQKTGAHFPSRVIPVMLGCDHSPPHEGVAQAVARANALQDEIFFEISDPEAYCKKARSREAALPQVSRELIGTRHQFILLGALSTRAFIKQANFAAESLLIRYAEPLATIARALGLGGWDAPLEEAWKSLMLNHAHDGIHGACVDMVHDEMLARYHRVRQSAAGIAQESMAMLAGAAGRFWREGERGVLFFDPSPAPEGRVAELWLPVDARGLTVLTPEGKPLACQVLSRAGIEPNGRGEPSALSYPAAELKRVLVALPPEGAQFSRARCLPGQSLPENPMKTGENWLENEHLRVTAKGALLTIWDKKTGRVFERQAEVIEEAEAGDFWDSSPTWIKSPAYTSGSAAAEVEILEAGPVRARMRVRFVMRVNARLEAGRRSAEMADIPMNLEVALLAGVRRADVCLTIDNRADDHKFSLDFSPGAEGALRCQSVFAELARDHAREAPAECVQPATPVYPMREWLAVCGPRGGLALAVRGLYNYAPLEGEPGRPSARLTLMRCVGNMSRINMVMRKGVAAWSVPSEGAQCRGRTRFEFSYLPLDADECFYPRVGAYLYPPLAHAVRGARAGKCVSLPPTVFSWDASNVRFSAFKKAEDGRGAILRLWENSGAETLLTLRIGGFSRVRKADLNERARAELTLADGVCHLAVRPYEIVTLRLERSADAQGPEAIPPAAASESATGAVPPGRPRDRRHPPRRGPSD